MLRARLITAETLRLSVRLIQNALCTRGIAVPLCDQHRTFRHDQVFDHLLKLYDIYAVIQQNCSRNPRILPQQADQDMLASHIALPQASGCSLGQHQRRFCLVRKLWLHQ